MAKTKQLSNLDADYLLIYKGVYKSNLDNCTQPGFYQISTPSEGYPDVTSVSKQGFLIVMKDFPITCQIYIPLYSPQLYIRYHNNIQWGSWRRLDGTTHPAKYLTT